MDNNNRKRKNLLDSLLEYSRSDYYPFHMPGHKRRCANWNFPDPYSVDITEIEGFDNLHHPEGILKRAMEEAAKIYGSDHSYYLINGSSGGILSCLYGAVWEGDTILMSRNCHKSVYHGVFLNRLKTQYLYPQEIPGFGVQGGLLVSDAEKLLKSVPEIRAMMIVSPTYDGVVSDVKSFADLAHRHGIPLIVDEAHGAHFSFGGSSKDFPQSALGLGADLVVQSLHKTLPSFTQTAILHMREGMVDRERLERYLGVFQSSSPSYVLMAGIERCISWMDREGREELKNFGHRLIRIRKALGAMKKFRLLDRDQINKNGVYDLDPSKIVISVRDSGIDGKELDTILRKVYHLEMEMCTADSVTALTSLMDTEEGFDRLEKALLETDKMAQGREKGFGKEKAVKNNGEDRKERIENSINQTLSTIETVPNYVTARSPLRPVQAMTVAEALDKGGNPVEWKRSVGQISAEFVYLYPPGIPVLAPGEIIGREAVELIESYMKMGLPVQGLADGENKTIQII